MEGPCSLDSLHWPVPDPLDVPVLHPKEGAQKMLLRAGIIHWLLVECAVNAIVKHIFCIGYDGLSCLDCRGRMMFHDGTFTIRWPFAMARAKEMTLKSAFKIAKST
eukprot:TRINITY_DN124728_c0_g2_i1.p5 TRINITY_DN124728_c0_g2~~TRINITY_DN124728_c0_g2_i1.p5  ORF type:complete len:106 (-),score=16.25 TRINITY_DN124728_c0_g2_i1:657-974(-)